MESISKELEITKEKLHTIEQAWEQETKLGKRYDSDNIKQLRSNSEYFFHLKFSFYTRQIKRKLFDKK